MTKLLTSYEYSLIESITNYLQGNLYDEIKCDDDIQLIDNSQVELIKNSLGHTHVLLVDAIQDASTVQAKNILTMMNEYVRLNIQALNVRHNTVQLQQTMELVHSKDYDLYDYLVYVTQYLEGGIKA